MVAAGVPWFMALFGRDSLLTSWMLLPLDTSLAIGTLQTLADHQGDKVDDDAEEEPGRILHEIRFGPTTDFTLGGRSVYYGTADATPLFVMLLGELRRWGGDVATIDGLLPHADRALDWIEQYGDADGDGFVEYERKTASGLVNQGWKDSWDGINFADGRIAEAPLALAEIQAYCYAAYRARAHFADHAGDNAARRHWTDKAAHLKHRFNETFWLPDRNWFAVGTRPRQDSDRRSHVEHRPLPMDGHHRRRQGRRSRRPPALTRNVHRLGHPHTRLVHGRVQPDELSQRIGLAARQCPVCQRVDALRLRRTRPEGRDRTARRSDPLRPPSA